MAVASIWRPGRHSVLDSILRSLDSSFGHDLSLKFPMGCLSGSHSSLLDWLSTRYQSQFTIFFVALRNSLSDHSQLRLALHGLRCKTCHAL